MNRNTLSDERYEGNASGFALKDRVGGEGGWNEDDGGISAGRVDGFLDGVEHGTTEMLGAALAWGDASDDLGAVLDHLLRVESAFAASHSAHNRAGVLVDKNRHMDREYRLVDAGYSGTPLPKKLGIKEGSVVRLVNRPDGWDLVSESGEGIADVIVVFCDWEAQLLEALEVEIDRLADRGGLWIAWPKRASKAPTDLTEDRLRDIILPLRLVDNKVCAIDEKWSGLRFVRRLRP